MSLLGIQHVPEIMGRKRCNWQVFCQLVRLIGRIHVLLKVNYSGVHVYIKCLTTVYDKFQGGSNVEGHVSLYISKLFRLCISIAVLPCFNIKYLGLGPNFGMRI